MEKGAGSKGATEALEECRTKIAAIEQKMGEKDADAEYIKYVTGDQVDGKLQGMLEKLRNDNQMLWKETVNMAEKTFSTGGI